MAIMWHYLLYLKLSETAVFLACPYTCTSLRSVYSNAAVVRSATASTLVSAFLSLALSLLLLNMNSCKHIDPVFFILYCDQQMSNYFTNYHTTTCFDTIISF